MEVKIKIVPLPEETFNAIAEATPMGLQARLDCTETKHPKQLAFRDLLDPRAAIVFTPQKPNHTKTYDPDEWTGREIVEGTK